MCELLVYFCVKLCDCFSVAHCTLSAAARQALSAWDLNGEMCHCEGAREQRRRRGVGGEEKESKKELMTVREKGKIAGRWLDGAEEIVACWRAQSADWQSVRLCVCVCVCVCLPTTSYVSALFKYVYGRGVVILQACHPPRPPHIHTHPTSLTAICPVINLRNIYCLAALHQITVCVCARVWALVHLSFILLACTYLRLPLRPWS